MIHVPSVICNAGPAIALGKLNRLDLLAVAYHEVQLPEPVYHEVVTQGAVRGEPDARTIRLFWEHQKWPVVPVPETQLRAVRSGIVLGRGELSVLALALRLNDAEALLDDAAARAVARGLGINVRGTLGIVVSAYRKRHLAFSELEFLFAELAERPDIWISARLCRQVLQELKAEAS